MSYRLDIKGRMYGVNAICGHLTTETGESRTVNIILQEKIDKQKTKEVLKSIKEKPSEFIFPALGKNVSDFQKEFSKAAGNAFFAEIHSPSYVSQTVSLVIRECDSPLIHFLCADKVTFWTLLRHLGTSKEDLLQLAEIDGLAHEERTDLVNKSIGTAHKFCDLLNKMTIKMEQQNATMPYIPIVTDLSGKPLGQMTNEKWIQKYKEILDKVRQSTKIKLPDYDHHLSFFSALHALVLIDLEACEMALQRKKFGKPNQDKRKFYKSFEGDFNEKAIHGLSEMSEDDLRQRQKEARQIWREVAGTKLDDQDFGDSPFYLRKFDPDSWDNNRLGYKIRHGYPLMPSKTCLFEIKRIDFEDPDTHVSLHNCPTIEENMLILAEDEGDNVRFTPMQINRDFAAFGPRPVISQFGYILKRVDGEFDRIETFALHEPHKHYDPFDAAKIDADIWKTYPLIVQCVNALTRFGDPEYRPVRKKPRPAPRTGFFKGRQEMFTYIHMDNPLDLDINMSNRSIQDGLRASPIIHWRRGHLRRYREGEKIIGISLIPPAIVGKEENGVIKRGYDFAKT